MNEWLKQEESSKLMKVMKVWQDRGIDDWNFWRVMRAWSTELINPFPLKRWPHIWYEKLSQANEGVVFKEMQRVKSRLTFELLFLDCHLKGHEKQKLEK